MKTIAFLLLCVAGWVQGLNNGLARTPPMGWLSWERFRCNIDCKDDPNNCISEKLFKDIADRMVSDGYKAAGYEYVNIDDCWLSKTRDANGRLQADPQRFPSGMKALADYMHSKGLKLGIYEDFGTKTCGGYPGSEYYLQTDAQTFADWGIDMLKLDGCYSEPKQYDAGYPPLAFWLNKTGRSILLSCEYPAYQRGAGIKPNYPALTGACNMARNYNDVQDSLDSVLGIIEFYGQNKDGFQQVAGPGFFNDPDMPDYPSIASHCNIWRNWNDIQDSWDSLASIISFYGDDHTKFSQVAGPGNFNDPDMLIIGNYGLSYDQQRVQMGMWAMMASPLIMSTDLRNIKPESKALLLNKNIIAINQDALGKQGKRVEKIGNIQVWTKVILPANSFAVAFMSTDTGGMPIKVSVQLKSIGLTNAAGYNVTEAFAGAPLGVLKPTDTLTASVNPTGIFMVKAVALS